MNITLIKFDPETNFSANIWSRCRSLLQSIWKKIEPIFEWCFYMSHKKE